MIHYKLRKFWLKYKKRIGFVLLILAAFLILVALLKKDAEKSYEDSEKEALMNEFLKPVIDDSKEDISYLISDPATVEFTNECKRFIDELDRDYNSDAYDTLYSKINQEKLRERSGYIIDKERFTESIKAIKKDHTGSHLVFKSCTWIEGKRDDIYSDGLINAKITGNENIPDAEICFYVYGSSSGKIGSYFISQMESGGFGARKGDVK